MQFIDEAGQQLGVTPVSDALKMAQARDLDLVEVGPNAEPPIVKIMDYGKYVYQKERQEKKQGKPKGQETKTVRVGFKTGIHDLTFKAEKAMEFLREGNIVKLELTLRGREKGLAGMGRDKLHNFLKMITEPYVAQGEPKRSPYGWVIMIQKAKTQPK